MADNEHPYYMLFVQSSEDVVIIPSDNCLKCFEIKTHDKILRHWFITEQEARKLRDAGTRGFKIKCICPKE